MRRLLALLLCSGIAVAAPADVTELVKKLKDKDVDVRRTAAQGLTEAGAKDAIGPLKDALKDNDAFVRRYAALALATAGPEAKPAVPFLGFMLMGEKERREGQVAAAVALGKIGAEAVPTLNLAIRHANLDPAARKKVIEIVAAMGPAAKETLPTLVDEFLGKKPIPGRTPLTEDDKVDLTIALSRIAGADDKAVITALETITKNEKIDDGNRLKIAASEALSKIMERK